MTFIQLKKTLLALLICLACSMEAEGTATKPRITSPLAAATAAHRLATNAKQGSAATAQTKLPPPPQGIKPPPAPKTPGTAPQKLDENATEEVDDTVKIPEKIDELLTTEELTSQKETEEHKTELFEQKNAVKPKLAREKWLAAQDKAIELTANLDNARAALEEKTQELATKETQQDAAKTLQRANTMPSRQPAKK